MNENKTGSVNFDNGRLLAICGLAGGVIIAVLTPLIVLKFGGGLTPTMQFTLVILCVSVGGLVALTAAFFGTVIPSSVPYDLNMEQEKLRALQASREATGD